MLWFSLDTLRIRHSLTTQKKTLSSLPFSDHINLVLYGQPVMKTCWKIENVGAYTYFVKSFLVYKNYQICEVWKLWITSPHWLFHPSEHVIVCWIVREHVTNNEFLTKTLIKQYLANFSFINHIDNLDKSCS